MITIKTADEIALLREGGRRLSEILATVVAAVKPGVTTKELDDLAATLIKEKGDKPSFLGYTPAGVSRPYPASSCISINENIIHGIPNENPRIIKEGDIVSVDIGLIHKGLFTDSAITVIAGNPRDEREKDLVKKTEESLFAGIKAARGGNHVGDIGYAIEQFVKKTPYKIAEDLCGHGVGRAVHEDPFVPNTGSRGEGPLLKPGMVLAIEPMLNIGTAKVVPLDDGYTYRTADNRPSAHFEHTVLITEGGPEILTMQK